jgi:predicted dehydrogenase
MIHDIDTTLALIKSPVKNISANGVSIISKTADIANARIEFENGCISNLTSSRISMKSMRKARFFQKDSYVSIDYLNKKVEVVKIKDAPKKNGPFDLILKNDSGLKKIITFDKPKVNEFNAILFELESFADSIIHNKPVVVTLSDGKRALNLALKISEKIKSTLK